MENDGSAIKQKLISVNQNLLFFLATVLHRCETLRLCKSSNDTHITHFILWKKLTPFLPTSFSVFFLFAKENEKKFANFAKKGEEKKSISYLLRKNNIKMVYNLLDICESENFYINLNKAS